MSQPPRGYPVTGRPQQQAGHSEDKQPRTKAKGTPRGFQGRRGQRRAEQQHQPRTGGRA